jgi:hypothetical protein
MSTSSTSPTRESQNRPSSTGEDYVRFVCLYFITIDRLKGIRGITKYIETKPLQFTFYFHLITNFSSLKGVYITEDPRLYLMEVGLLCTDEYTYVPVYINLLIF